MALFATLMAGTAALPHIVTRFFTLPNERSARLSGAWGALFVLVLLITLPALAAFAKLALFKLILAPTSFADLPRGSRGSHGSISYASTACRYAYTKTCCSRCSRVRPMWPGLRVR